MKKTLPCIIKLFSFSINFLYDELISIDISFLLCLTETTLHLFVLFKLYYIFCSRDDEENTNTCSIFYTLIDPIKMEFSLVLHPWSERQQC